MPVSRLTTDGLAVGVHDVYADAEVRLLRLIATHLAAGHEAPQWAEDKLAELQQVRAQAQAIVAAANQRAASAVSTATATAYRRGTAAAEGELSALDVTARGAPNLAARAVTHLVAAQQDRLDTAGLHVVRQTVDGYRAAVVRAAGGTLTGSATRLQDAQAALNELASKGIAAFTDTAGRQWALPTYVEMATRSTTAQASILGHLDRLEQAGIPLAIVSDSPSECELCAPWEGKVLSRGPAAALMRNARTGAMEAVPIDGTVDAAVAAGLFHPNCTHNLSAYVHGVTRRGMATHNPRGYEDRQEQRRLERQVRTWRRRQSVAVTPEAQRQAEAKVAEHTAASRAHAASTGQTRKTNRETPGRAR